MSNFRDRFAFWREQYPGEWWFDFTGKLTHLWWRFQDWRRSKNPELVELDAFRSLINLERQLEEWPRAIPLLEQALKLYDLTQQTGKREAIRERLAAVEPANPNVREYFEVEERKARQETAIKVSGMTDEQKQELDLARSIVKETGRCSTAMLQRRMGISYNHAAEFVSIIHAEMQSQES